MIFRVKPVRETRKKWFAFRDKLLKCKIQGLEAWVKKSAPPYLCVESNQHVTPDKFPLDEIPKQTALLRLGSSYGGAGGDMEI
ncbi:hypothetical protein QYM36_015017 [Artemia franciscana]|uniref:Uncharacterized protein n=1 Tax=Artemia franciscana TaxID=6661 RepID=A0AA88KYV5_ARTSF|nr:hypothetical protein QYM36_015017 [Artemia franciscana]